MRTFKALGFLFLSLAGATHGAFAQSAKDPTASAYVFATPAEGRAILGARDEYVRASSALERSAKLKTADKVDEGRFMQFMQGTVLDWTEEERRRLRPLVARLDRFLSGLKWKRSGKILLVRVDAALENGAPHTRANGIMLPKNELTGTADLLTYVVSHETFHVLTREDAELKERLYGAIGFRRCERIEIPDSVSRMRITNPDAVENRHSIAVRYRDRDVEAMPFVRFKSDDIDTRSGFLGNTRTAWLLVDRERADCRVRTGSAAEAEEVAPQELQGLFEQIGRNTRYLAHPEEILADNFFQLFVSTLRSPGEVQSPEVLERMRAILFQ